ncbi:MAG TPA: CBS domain-containing protein [Acidimicrobiales bacterium]|nr:CBS domain-containing protein [Acidimicrobiales bacterium]
MPDAPVFVSRLARLSLLDGDGQPIGKVSDVVLSPAYGAAAPRVVGFIADVQRRRIFINAGRVGEFDAFGVRLRGGTVDLRHFRPRTGEMLATDLFDRSVEGAMVMDVAIARSDTIDGWEVSSVALGDRGTLRRRTRRVIPWNEVRSLFDGGPMAAQVAALRDLNPADLAAAVHLMPAARRRAITEAITDEELADVLEELPEEDQVRILTSLDLERMADVVQEMEPDDAVDLLEAMSAAQRVRVLSAMEPGEADVLRRLLSYAPTTAGGLMTSEPVIATPEVPVAEVLARVRQAELPPSLAAQVFVCEPPTATPTGRFLGTVGFQRLMREAPSVPVGNCVQDSTYVRPDLSQLQVAERLAAYNLVGLPVCDDAGRLLGAVTVDDVLDRVLPAGWRRHRR